MTGKAEKTVSPVVSYPSTRSREGRGLTSIEKAVDEGEVDGDEKKDRLDSEHLEGSEEGPVKDPVH